MPIDRNFKRRIVLILMILLWWASTTQAAVPLLINYQGSLTDDVGNPLDGNYQVVFSIYDLPIGGTVLWSETQIVSVAGGIYNVVLGQPGNEIDPVDIDEARWLGVAVGTDGEMTPRQPLTSVPFAMQADSTPAGAVTSIMLADEAVTEAKVASVAITADKIVGGTGSGVDADQLDGLDADAFSLSGHNHDGSYYSQAHVDALEDRIAALEAKLQYLTVVAGTVNQMPGPHVMITGANLHVRSGSGSTYGTINGRGNLIVGYNELRGSGDDRTGSHNFVTGTRQNYSHYGGLVAGFYNTISSAYASVSGGNSNTASGPYASVGGGSGNAASDNYSSVCGGSTNTASGVSSTVSGGETRSVTGTNDWRAGGYFQDQ